jgi:hypothetical protein
MFVDDRSKAEPPTTGEARSATTLSTRRRGMIPEGESSPAVKAPCKSVVDDHLAQDPNAPGNCLAKPSALPRERPLQRRP